MKRRIAAIGLIWMMLIGCSSVAMADLSDLLVGIIMGDAEAMYQVGVLYETGDGVEQSYDEALFWYQKAAEQNHLEAMNAIGWFYRKGLSVPPKQ